MTDFHRIKRLPPYVFEQVNRIKAQARAGGADIIDLGMGNPDLPAPQHVIDKLVETAGKPRTDRYSASKGIAGLRRAQAGYYARRFGVKLNPDTPGRRDARLQGGLRQHGAGDHRAGRRGAGAEPELPDPRLRLPDGRRRDPLRARRALARPSSRRWSAPSSTRSRSRSRSWSATPRTRPPSVASLDFYRDLVAFAKKHELILLSDLAYAEVYFDGGPPPSVLQVPGAMDVAVEFTSMSKTFSMAGWRIGFAVGNERLLAALARVKSYLDYGAFTPVQVAATAALNGPEDCIREMRALYKRRRDALVDSFAKAGWPIPAPTRLDVRLGADPGALPRRSAAWSSRSSWSRRPMSRSRRASASASTATTTSASRSSRTSSASARPPATSAASSTPPTSTLHNVVPIARAAG